MPNSEENARHQLISKPSFEKYKKYSITVTSRENRTSINGKVNLSLDGSILLFLLNNTFSYLTMAVSGRKKCEFLLLTTSNHYVFEANVLESVFLTGYSGNFGSSAVFQVLLLLNDFLPVCESCSLQKKTTLVKLSYVMEWNTKF